MSTLKWIGYTIAAILVLSVLLGGGAFILIAAAVIGVLFTLAAMVSFVAFCIKEWFEDKTKPRDPG